MHETRVTGSLESLAYFLACFPGPDRLTSGCVSLEDYIRSNSTELVYKTFQLPPTTSTYS